MVWPNLPRCQTPALRIHDADRAIGDAGVNVDRFLAVMHAAFDVICYMRRIVITRFVEVVLAVFDFFGADMYAIGRVT